MAPTTHGLSKTPAYRAWARMHDRCANPKVSSFYKYGGRGVRICDRWNIAKGGSFENFFSDMGQPPSHEHQLEKDIKGCIGCLTYSPDTCSWATPKENSRHRTSSKFLTHNGETLCQSEWAERLGINVCTLYSRLETLGWSLEKALTTPSRAKK